MRTQYIAPHWIIIVEVFVVVKQTMATTFSYVSFHPSFISLHIIELTQLYGWIELLSSNLVK